MTLKTVEKNISVLDAASMSFQNLNEKIRALVDDGCKELVQRLL
jgi:hypothetical protein